MCANLELYNRIRTVPAEAKKPIQAGRLKGKTDINPMWRIKKLTEEFGICGIGWKTTVERMWLENGANGEVTANVHIHLYIRDPESKEWSEPIVGIGGAAFISNEKGGAFTDDDCYKKAYTDAISIACKALGMAADVYYEKDPDSKYTGREDTPGDTPPQVPFPEALMTYEKALEYKLVGGKYRGMTVAEAFKKDIKYFYPVNEPLPTKDIEAINLVKAGIAAKNAQK